VSAAGRDPEPSGAPVGDAGDGPRLEVAGLRAPGLGPLRLALAPGECVALRGPSGSGKTRLLRAVADLDPNEAQVRLDGAPRAALAPSLWRRRVGYLPVDSRWWLGTVAAHFPRPDADTLAALDLDARLLDRPVRELSSGERQRFALLRLLANDPRVLLLDEPTANLDAASARAAEALVAQHLASRRASALWVTHDAPQAQRVAAREIRIEQGRIAGTAPSPADAVTS